jgi:cellobiose-specific phosphotransferase system component IIC
MKIPGFITKVMNWAVCGGLDKWPFILFNVSLVPAFWWLGVDKTNIGISILTTDILLYSLVRDAKRMEKLEKEIDELTRVHPDVDETAIVKD